MKLQIVLFILAAIALCSTAEKMKGRRSKLRIEQLLRNDKDNPSSGRWLHKKNQDAQPQTIIILQPPTQDTLTYDVDFDGTLVSSDIDDNSTRAFDDDFLDSEDEVENEKAPIRNERRNSNLKLKKINGKKQVYSNIAPSKKGVNKLQMIRLNGNSNKYPENYSVRRLVIPQ